MLITIQTDESIWMAKSGDQSKPKNKKPHDHIESYLADPVLSSETITTMGGYLAHWEAVRTSRPSVTRMALDYISAPGE